MRLVVEADDYQTAVAFYRDVLGLTEELAVAGPNGAHVTILEAGRATLEIVNPAQKEYIDHVEVGRPVAHAYVSRSRSPTQPTPRLHSWRQGRS